MPVIFSGLSTGSDKNACFLLAIHWISQASQRRSDPADLTIPNTEFPYPQVCTKYSGYLPIRPLQNRPSSPIPAQLILYSNNRIQYKNQHESSNMICWEKQHVPFWESNPLCLDKFNLCLVFLILNSHVRNPILKIQHISVLLVPSVFSISAVYSFTFISPSCFSLESNIQVFRFTKL